MSKMARWVAGLFIAALVVGGPWGYAHYRQKQGRNLRVVRPGVLYRSGQMTLPAFQRTAQDLGIRTVITLRDTTTAGEGPPDLREEEYCRAAGIRHVRIPPRRWGSPVGDVPAEEGVRRFREVMDDARNYPVLVHCFRGVHRTGAYCAIYRMEYDHWSNDEAITEMRRLGYTDLEDEWDLLGYLETYQPRWKSRADAGPVR